MKIKKILRSGRVRRWHSNPDLAHTNQTNAEHQWAVAVIAHYLFPHNSELIISSLLHDAGEIGIGDMSGKFKRSNPDIQTLLEHAESENRISMGIRVGKTEQLNLCDQIEAYLWAHNHHATNSMAWDCQLQAMVQTSKKLGVYEKLREIIPHA